MPVQISIGRVLCDTLILIFLAIPMLIFHKWVKPYKRGFYCDDESLRYPYLESTITRYELVAVGMPIPIIIIVLTELYRVYFWEKSCSSQFKKYQCGSRKIHRLIVRLYVFLGYFFLGVCFNQLMVDIGKYTIGRHRPHFMEVCKPNIGYTTCPGDHKYINDFECTGTDKKAIHESMLSFYSGHASFSFFIAWYISLYLRARLYRPLFSRLIVPVIQFALFFGATWVARLIVPVIQFALFFGATWVAYTRVSDYKHHWSDVLIGSMLGSSIGIILALYIAEVFKRREIPPAHDSSCQFGLIPIDSKNVANVEEGIGVDIPISSVSRPQIITARQIVLTGDERGPSIINNTAPSPETNKVDDLHLLEPVK
uniref:Phosphatidic acid phosphatase type 2/haloperoxidase domain-containing protein n=1 Tax=Panagrolaimus sp. JU765 TaxID=591449 RepID=A0AC34QIT9_9BILA